MPEGVAEHQMTDPQPLGLGGHPGGDPHCLPDAFVGQAGRLEVIDESDAVETAGLGPARTLGDVARRQPDLRQEQVPLGHAPPMRPTPCH